MTGRFALKIWVGVTVSQAEQSPQPMADEIAAFKSTVALDV
jgi:hypothetical protein